jgi:hypothetical protein
LLAGSDRSFARPDAMRIAELDVRRSLLRHLGLSICSVRSPERLEPEMERTGCGREALWALVAQVAVRPVMVGLAAVVLVDYAGFGSASRTAPG